MNARHMCTLVLAFVLSLSPVVRSGAEEPVAVELVLAIDTSASVDAEEFELQFRGLANAFRDPGVLTVIAETYPIGLVVCVVQWAGPYSQAVAVPWRHIRAERDALALADEISAVQRIFLIDVTAIGEAVSFSAELLRTNGYVAPRQVIDVSGDGPNNYGTAPHIARDLAVAQGITINGLVILNQQAHVYRHYSAEVIGGIGSFVQTANRFADYGEAITKKLIREIQGPPLSEHPQGNRLAETGLQR